MKKLFVKTLYVEPFSFKVNARVIVNRYLISVVDVFCFSST